MSDREVISWHHVVCSRASPGRAQARGWSRTCLRSPSSPAMLSSALDLRAGDQDRITRMFRRSAVAMSMRGKSFGSSSLRFPCSSRGGSIRWRSGSDELWRGDRSTRSGVVPMHCSIPWSGHRRRRRTANVDLSMRDLDAAIEALKSTRTQSVIAMASCIAKDEAMKRRQIGKRYGESALVPQLCASSLTSSPQARRPNLRCCRLFRRIPLLNLYPAWCRHCSG